MNRRDFVKLLSILSAAQFIPISDDLFAASKANSLITKKIPSSGEKIPVIGMGTWITFNVGSNNKLKDQRTEVLAEFFKKGGSVIDSSPMYGSSEEVLGYALKKLGKQDQVFAATKIWTSSKVEGVEQFKNSQKLWGLDKIELQQIHNLLGLGDQLELLKAEKEKGNIKYLGITTSHGRRHSDFMKLMKSEPLDFVQLTYNVEDREAEPLLNLANEKGIAVLVNRPYDGGALITRLKKEKLPTWAMDQNLKSWAEILLKYIVSHPAVTCAVPATSQIAHMTENMGACHGELLNQAMREKIRKYIQAV